MARRKLKAGTTGVAVPIFVQDTSGAGLTLAYNAPGLVAEYRRQGQSGWTAITLAAGTLGTWSPGGWAADGGLAGAYEVGIPDAALASGRWALVRFRGATDMLPVQVEFELDAVDYQDATRFGLAALPGVAAAAAGGLPTLGTGSGQIDLASGRVNLGKVVDVAVSLVTGTAQGGSSTSITLAAGSSSGTDFYKNWTVQRADTDEWAVVTAYNGTTKVATIRGSWSGAAPTGSTGYTLEPPAAATLELWEGVAPNPLASGRVDANATASLGATAPAGWIDANALAANAVTAAKLAAGALAGQAVASVAGDLGGKVLGGGAGTITGTGVRAVDGSGNALAPATATTAIKAITDELATALQANGSGGFQFTTLALANAPAGGGGGLTQQQVRDALKLAPSVGAAATGSIDALAAAVKAKTDNLPASPAAVGSAMTLAAGAITTAAFAAGATLPRVTLADSVTAGVGLSPAAQAALADVILARDAAGVEGSAAEHTLCGAILLLTEWDTTSNPGHLTVHKTDGSVFATKNLTTTTAAGADVITGVD